MESRSSHEENAYKRRMNIRDGVAAMLLTGAILDGTIAHQEPMIVNTMVGVGSLGRIVADLGYRIDLARGRQQR